MRLSPGSTLGPYEITGPVGAGGMGEVYRARDTRLGREVAVKVLPHDVADNPERLARFEREARSASALNHPAIVTLHEFAATEGRSDLVMELVRGESLRDVLARGAVPPRQLFPIAAAVADGLAAAHAAGIVHRDLKPENMMVTGDGAPKILDFGLVKGNPAVKDPSGSATELVTEAGVVYGTASYMSPEQARGEAVDFRSDQFALGLILSEMATGRHPFQRGTAFETLAAIINDDPEPLSDSLPEPFVWIVERCLAKRPSERYGSTADLARDLARLRDRSTGVRQVTQRKRVAWGWWLATAGAALLGALLATAAMRPRSSNVAGDPLQVSVSMPAIANVFIGEVAQPVAISPDGRYLAVYGADATGTYHLWLHDLRSGTTKLLAENAFAAAWSNDSRSIAYFAEGKLKTISVDGGPPQTVCDARPESTPSWHGDTILFAQYSRAPGIYRVDAGGGSAQLIVGPEKDNPDFAWWPQFLPDGTRFLFLALRQPNGERTEITHELFVGSLDGSPAKPIAAIDSRAVFADGHLLFVRDGTLLAHPFDLDALTLTGEAVSLVEGLHYFRSTGLAAFSVSTNGVLAWRAARGPSRLVWFDRSGMEVGSIGTRLTEGLRLSRDGMRVALGLIDPKQGVSDIWIHDLSRESPDRMTFQLLDEKFPVWAPDGTIYYRTDGGGGPPDVFKLTPGQGRDAVYRGPGVNEPHDVSPDGRWLLMIDYTPPVGADISVLPLAPPGPARRFATTPFQELSPRFSPDGQWVAYSSDSSGRPEVYVRPFEGSAAPVRVSQSGGLLPRWNPKGNELFFLGPGGRLMVVPVAGGDFGVPRVLFQVADAADYEVSPDGTRFLVHLPERREPVHLLVNWRARLPPER